METPEASASEQAGNKRFDPSIGAATQFRPGQSGNPGGRPKRKWLTDVWDEMLEEKLSDPQFRAEYKENTWAKMQSKGVVSAMFTDRVVERTEGKLPQAHEHSGEVALTISERMMKAEQRLKDVSKSE